MIILFWIVGLLLIGLAIPLLRRKVGPNSLYGLRVAETLENEDVWYEANARSAKDLLRLGVGTIVVPSILIPTGWVNSDIFVLAGCAMLVVGTLWYCARGIKIAKEVKLEMGSRPD